MAPNFELLWIVIQILHSQAVNDILVTERQDGLFERAGRLVNIVRCVHCRQNAARSAHDVDTVEPQEPLVLLVQPAGHSLEAPGIQGLEIATAVSQIAQQAIAVDRSAWRQHFHRIEIITGW